MERVDIKKGAIGINDLGVIAYVIAKEKGFHDGKMNIGEKLMLITSELGEALEADRKNRYADIGAYRADLDRLHGEPHSPEDVDAMRDSLFEHHVKDTFEDELADALIRIVDLAEAKGINLEYHVREKVRYNSGRDQKHGKKY